MASPLPQSSNVPDSSTSSSLPVSFPVKKDTAEAARPASPPAFGGGRRQSHQQQQMVNHVQPTDHPVGQANNLSESPPAITTSAAPLQHPQPASQISTQSTLRSGRNEDFAQLPSQSSSSSQRSPSIVAERRESLGKSLRANSVTSPLPATMPSIGTPARANIARDVVENGKGLPPPTVEASTEAPGLVLETKKEVDQVRRVSVVVGELAGWQARRLSSSAGGMGAGQIVFVSPDESKITSVRPDIAVESDESDVEDSPRAVVAEDPGTRGPFISQPKPSSTTTSTIKTTTTLKEAGPSAKPVQPSAGIAAPLTKEEIAKILALPGNDECADCGSSLPTWASVSNGILVCLACSGQHRGLGSHISFVRSLDLDSWRPDQVASMMMGGNAKFRELFKTHSKAKGIDRYSSQAAEDYRAQLRVLSGSLPSNASGSFKPIERKGTNRAFPPIPPKWIADKESNTCSMCERSFSVLVRRHHCRLVVLHPHPPKRYTKSLENGIRNSACGKLCCSNCAPAQNTKPLPQFGYGSKPQRHCARCYRSPFVNWVGSSLLFPLFVFQRLTKNARNRNQKSRKLRSRMRPLFGDRLWETL